MDLRGRCGHGVFVLNLDPQGILSRTVFSICDLSCRHRGGVRECGA